MRFLNPSEIATLAETIGERFKAFVLLGGYGGLRLGELVVLRRERVDLLRAAVEVAETASYPGGRLQVGPPKTLRRPAAGADPAAWWSTVLEEHFARCIGPNTPTVLVFGRPDGRHLQTQHFRADVWKPAVERAGLAPLRIHDLRHSAVTLWIAAGASPVEIAARAGHTSVSVVLDRYGHLLPSSESTVNAALDALAETATAARDAEVLRLARDGRGMGTA